MYFCFFFFFLLFKIYFFTVFFNTFFLWNIFINFFLNTASFPHSRAASLSHSCLYLAFPPLPCLFLVFPPCLFLNNSALSLSLSRALFYAFSDSRPVVSHHFWYIRNVQKYIWFLFWMNRNKRKLYSLDSANAFCNLEFWHCSFYVIFT